MKDVLVITGGAGFCGTHLAEHFQTRYKVRLFDRFSRDSLKFAPHLTGANDIEVVQADILDRNALHKAFDGASAVIHCAAIAGVSTYYEKPVELLHVNILGTFHVLDAVVEARVPRVIQFSTSEVYGPNANGVTEMTPPMTGLVSDRRWGYAVSKLASEHITLRYGEIHGFSATTVRPFNIYGPRQTGEGAISNFATKLVRGEPLEIYGDGSDVRAWCHASDLAAAIDLMLHNDAAAGKTFNIGNPDANLSTLELAKTMISIYGEGEFKHVEAVHTPIPLRIPDISLARSVLGFEPKVGVEAGLADTLDWYRSIDPSRMALSA